MVSAIYACVQSLHTCRHLPGPINDMIGKRQIFNSDKRGKDFVAFSFAVHWREVNILSDGKNKTIGVQPVQYRLLY